MLEKRTLQQITTEADDHQPGLSHEDEWDNDNEERKRRSDADQPRLWERDITILRWVGEQGAASADNLRELAGREAAAPTKEPGLLSKTRIRHLIEDRWQPAGMISWDTMMGRKWIWLTRRALQRVDLPFTPHRPADTTLNHLHHCNRVRLYLEQLYASRSLQGSWESARLIERSKKEWKGRKKEDSYVFIPYHYRMWHMPDAIWTFRNRNDTDEHKIFIEVEASSKGPERTADILTDLARHGVTWYFVEMDTKKHVYATLIEALNSLEEEYQARFIFYDLAKPTRLIHQVKREKKSS